MRAALAAGTIFAYGQTGTGKTHTMEGVLEPKEQQARGRRPALPALHVPRARRSSGPVPPVPSLPRR